MTYPISYEVPGWTPCEHPSKRTMLGQYCDLQVPDPSLHGDALYAALCPNGSDHNWTYMPYGPFDNKAAFDVWLAELPNSRDPLFHAIINKATGQAAGIASFLRITGDVGVIEVGHIHYGNEIQRTAIATEAMYLMMCRVFDELGYRRYEWKCDALNARSRSAALRLGFTFEGIFRQATLYKGRNRDTAWFAMLDSDWPVIKRVYENWLAADNFDRSGSQRKPLAINR
ncbi:MAG: GNAT family protein [Granulosicoccaceae bacterium]